MVNDTLDHPLRLENEPFSSAVSADGKEVILTGKLGAGDLTLTEHIKRTKLNTDDLTFSLESDGDPNKTPYLFNVLPVLHRISVNYHDSFMGVYPFQIEVEGNCPYHIGHIRLEFICDDPDYTFSLKITSVAKTLHNIKIHKANKDGNTGPLITKIIMRAY